MDSDAPNGFDERVQQRTAAQTPLETISVTQEHRGRIPNTPLAASTISFLLGIVFCLGMLTFLSGGFDIYWWSTYQLGFFAASWSAFHWGEFAVTAGWNREKCSVDCTHARPEFHAFYSHRSSQHSSWRMALSITLPTVLPSSNISSRYTLSRR